MNRHGIKTEKRLISFYSFMGGSKSTLDQITLPPSDEQLQPGRMYHTFGEWLKRNGHDWKYLSEEALCRLGTDYFNEDLREWETPRRFDRMATRAETDGQETP